MKQYIIGILIVITIISCNRKLNVAQTTLHQIITYTEENSLYRNEVEWDTLKPQIISQAKEAKSISDISPALKYMLKALGDEHGQVIFKNQMIGNYYGPLKKHHKNMEIEVYNELQSGDMYKFHSQLLKGSIGYVRIVSLPMGDNENMAKEIQDEVCKLSENGAESWIIDLRYNTGGNLMPMAEGLALIIGDDSVGGARGLTEEESLIWRIKDGDFYIDDYSVRLKNDCNVPASSKVAVLVSSYTASSGEALAVIFKGRENTKLFGQKTFGFVTGNDYQFLNDSIAVNLSVNYYHDRNGIVYDKYIDVDEEVSFSKSPLSTNDKAVEIAEEWILEKTDDYKRQ